MILAGVSRPSAPEIKREPKRHVKREVKREHQDRSAGAVSSSSSSSASASRSDAKMPATPELNRMGYRRIGDGMAMVDVDGEKQPMRTCLRRRPPSPDPCALHLYTSLGLGRILDLAATLDSTLLVAEEGQKLVRYAHLLDAPMYTCGVMVLGHGGHRGNTSSMSHTLVSVR